MKVTTIISACFLFCAGISCSPSGNPGTSQNQKDTLTTGWSITTVTSSRLIDIFFQNSTVGYIGGERCYKTNDAGKTWAPLPDSVSADNMFVTDDGTVFTIVNHKSKCYRLSNWGTTITGSIVNIFTVYSGDLFFTDSNNGFIVSKTGINKTTDAGNSWALLTGVNGLTFSDSYATCYFTDTNTGWVISGQKIFRSNADLQNWAESNVSGMSNSFLASIFAVSKDIVYAGGGDGAVFKSTDGGRNFSKIASLYYSATDKYLDIHFVDSNTGYACYQSRIYKTTDGGATWVKVVGLVQSQIIEVHFTDANHGWACTVDGKVLKFEQ